MFINSICLSTQIYANADGKATSSVELNLFPSSLSHSLRESMKLQQEF